MQYGQAPMGVAPSLLHGQRVSAMAVVAAGARGRDLDLTLLLADTAPTQRTDPAFAAHIDPIYKWAQAVWCHWVPHSLLNHMVTRARLALTKARKVWSVVKGPASATVATAARLGWTVHGATSITTDDGVHLDLTLDPPITITHHVVEAVRRWQWRRVADKFPALAAPHGSPQPRVDVAPIRRLLARDRPAEAWLAHHRAALSSAVCGGQWPQARLHSAGLVDHPHCMLCFREAEEAQRSGAHVDWGTVPHGTAIHRIAECIHLDGPRNAAAPQELVQRMKRALANDPLTSMSHGPALLSPAPRWSFPPRPLLTPFGGSYRSPSVWARGCSTRTPQD